jgi:hypothetical protein
MLRSRGSSLWDFYKISKAELQRKSGPWITGCRGGPMREACRVSCGILSDHLLKTLYNTYEWCFQFGTRDGLCSKCACYVPICLFRFPVPCLKRFVWFGLYLKERPPPPQEERDMRITITVFFGSHEESLLHWNLKIPYYMLSKLKQLFNF